MARQEQDREDLLREATALVPRGELRLEVFDEPVVIGFRRGAASLYLGADPALHFTLDNRLRRGYVDGLLIKAEGGRLVQMRRVRTAGEVQLQSRQLSEQEQQELLLRIEVWVTAVADSFKHDCYELIGEEPKKGGFVQAASDWLRQLSDQAIAVAQQPGL